MTANEIYSSAIKLLGYNNEYLSLESNPTLIDRAVEIINRIGDDLCCMPKITSLNDEISAAPKFIDAFISGVCMLISLSEGDTQGNTVFTDSYNKKRAIAKAQKEEIKDNMPYALGCSL